MSPRNLQNFHPSPAYIEFLWSAILTVSSLAGIAIGFLNVAEGRMSEL